MREEKLKASPFDRDALEPFEIIEINILAIPRIRILRKGS